MNLRPGLTVVDATLGTGGHAQEILKRINPGGLLIGIDKDEESLEVCRDRLDNFKDSLRLIHGDFRDLDSILEINNIHKIDAIIFDLGLSLYQLSDPQRGFSFQQEGPLDMRFDRHSFISAYDLINHLNVDEISNLLWTFGQENKHRHIANLIVKERQKHPIQTTRELADLVMRAVKFRRQSIHPATRTFQALRIAVNRELEVLADGLNKAIELLKTGGRIVVISFHSLEDRIVKQNFRRSEEEKKLKIITPKPLRPSEDEINLNPSSRSAKMRVAERI